MLWVFFAKKLNLIDMNLKISHSFILFLILLTFPFLGFTQQTCVQTATASGLDSAPTLCTINPVNCQGAGIISAVSMDASIGNACMFGWYYYNLKVDGVTVATYMCDVTNYDLSSYLPFSSVTLESADQNFIGNNITLNLSLSVTYNANFCSGTPLAGNAVANEFVACASDSFEVNLNGQSTGLGLSYQWQTSTDNQNWTNLIGDTLLTLTTAISNDSYFRCEVTCNASGAVAYSSSDFVAYGYCTPATPVICNTQFNAGPEVLNISGFPGSALSPVVLSFEYHGSFSWASSYLTVTDYVGNVIGQLNGASVTCDTVIDSLILSAADFNSLLIAGNGTIPLTVTPTSVFNNCTANGTNVGYCISVSAKAVPFLLQNDVGVGQLLSPEVGLCALDSAVSFELHNVGSTNLTSADISWSVNGVVQSAQSWTGNLNSLMKDTISLGTFAGGFNEFDTILIWVANPNNAVDSNSLNDTINQIVHPGLSGNYVIDHAGTGEFTSFTEAINAAYEFGFCGPVVFEVANGTYVEQILLETEYINGISEINTLEFTSVSQDSSLVELSYSPSTFNQNYTVQLNNCEYVSFSHIGFKSFGVNYSRVLFTSNDAFNNHISFSNCLFETAISSGGSQHNTLAYLYSDSNNYWEFSNNRFVGGSFSLRLGKSGATAAVGTIIEDNHFSDMENSGIYLTHQDSALVNNNYMTSNSTNFSNKYALYAYDMGVGSIISNNQIVGGSNWPTYGMYLTNVQGSSSASVNVYNNRISISDIDGKYGMYFSNCEYLDIYHNSIFSLAETVDNSGMRFYNGVGLDVRNNIIQAHGTNGGNVIFCNSENVFSNLDYNVYSTNSGNIAQVDTVYYPTLSAWVLASNFNDSALTVDSVYSDYLDLKVCADSIYQRGVGVGVVWDFENDPRMTTPSIGADEFMSIAEVGNMHSGYELCDGDTLELSQYYFDVVEWNGVPSNTISVSSSGTQSLFVDGACGSATVPVVVDAQQYVGISDENNCENDSVLVVPSIANGLFVWHDGSTDSVFVADSAQTVTVQYTSSLGGCVSLDSAVVTQSANVRLSADSAEFCEGSSFTITGDISGNYLWSTGETGAFITVDSTGTYSVTVTEQNCVSSDSTYAREILNPVAMFTDSVDGFTVYFTSTSQNEDSYYWDFGDGNSSTVENPVHTYNSAIDLNYNVSLTVSNVCADNTWSTWVTDGPGSVTEMEWANQVSVYPNPMLNQLQVEISNINYDNGEITVMNTAGAKLHYRRLSARSGSKFNIDVTDFAAGVYFIKVELDAGFTIRKVVKL